MGIQSLEILVQLIFPSSIHFIWETVGIAAVFNLSGRWFFKLFLPWEPLPPVLHQLLLLRVLFTH